MNKQMTFTCSECGSTRQEEYDQENYPTETVIEIMWDMIDTITGLHWNHIGGEIFCPECYQVAVEEAGRDHEEMIDQVQADYREGVR